MIKNRMQRLANRLGYRISRIAPELQPVIAAPDREGIIRELKNDFYLLPKSEITYHDDLLYTYHNCDFIQDPHFAEAYRLGKETDVEKSVLIDTDIYWRVHVLCWAARHASKLEGDFVDCGVNSGIFARSIIHYIDFNSTGKTYFLLDTFTGLDPRYSTEKELDQDLNHRYNANKHTLYEQVQERFKDFNTKIIQGAVPDVLPQVPSDKIAFLSVDMNCVRPEVDALNFFWDKMVPGGIIILDDYGYGNHHNEQKRAHDAFARSKQVEVLTLPTCQGMIIKP